MRTVCEALNKPFQFGRPHWRRNLPAGAGNSSLGRNCAHRPAQPSVRASSLEEESSAWSP
eukprot:116240-Prorocentrum_minimum.AAC.2